MFVIFPLEDILCASSSSASKSSPHVEAVGAADLIDAPISVTLQAKRADGRLHLTFSSTQPAAVGPSSPSPTSTGPINCAPLWSDAMSSESSSSCFKDLVHPSHSEALKTHNGLTIKLLKTVSEFTQQLSAAHEQHAEQLQQLVETFRKKNAELRKERPAGVNGLFQVWETLLQEVEVDSAVVSEIANSLGRQVSRPLIEGTFHRKLEARKIFQHRETLENALEKAALQLDTSYELYDEAYQQHLNAPNTLTLAAYLELHNNYVQDVHATNAMADQYHNVILPQLIQELESVYTDLSRTVTSTIQQGCEVMSNRAEGMSKRYNSLAVQCRSVNPSHDLSSFVRNLGPPVAAPVSTTTGAINSTVGFTRFAFVPPRVPANGPLDMQDPSLNLKDELVFDRLAGFSLRTKHEALKKEVAEIETQIRQCTDCLDTLVRMQQRSLEANLFNKANELQEEICVKRLELRMAQLHLAGCKAQRDLYGSRAEMSSDGVTMKESSRKNSGSNSSAGSMKTKWMKAFRTLTNSATTSSSQAGSSNTSNSSSGSSTVPAGVVNNSSASASAAGMGGASSAVTNISPNSSEGSRLYQAVMAVMALRKTGPSRNEKASRPSEFILDSRHIFQEYTYKKVTPCDVCSQILRGHSRQGLKCRLCKINVHTDCKDGVGRCLPKSRLLRRQKSSSEIEARTDYVDGDDGNVDEPDTRVLDQTYMVLKQAGELGQGSVSTLRRYAAMEMERHAASVANPSATSAPSGGSNLTHDGGNFGGSSGAINRPVSTRNSSLTGHPPTLAAKSVQNPNSLSVGLPSSFHPSSSAPHSPRRQKLNLRMKSFSLDESGEHCSHGGIGHRHPSSTVRYSASQGSSYSQSPSSPVHNRRLLSARNIRMNSVELPDDNEKSQSSASASPCPSPSMQKRLLPTNLYVVLFNFKSRQSDELDLKAGYKVTVIDSSDPDWWKGKCLGKIGFFPSKYVAKLAPNEKPLQVTHNLQINENDGGFKLLRDQIVIQVCEGPTDGMVTVRNGDNKQGVCPIQYLQEV